MLEVFDATQNAQPTAWAHSLSPDSSDKDFRRALGTDAVPESMRPRKSRMRDRFDARRDGWVGTLESGGSDGLGLSCVSLEVCGKEWGTYVEKQIFVL